MDAIPKLIVGILLSFSIIVVALIVLDRKITSYSKDTPVAESAAEDEISVSRATRTGGVTADLLFLWAAGVIAYFIPALIAMSRHHQNATAIVLLNFFLGWTLIGWVGSLVWSATAVRQA